MRPPSSASYSPVQQGASWLTHELVYIVVNIVAGFALAILVQLCALPFLGLETSVTSKSLVAALFAALSTLQSCMVLRIFIGIEKAEERERRARARTLEQLFWTGRV